MTADARTTHPTEAVPRTMTAVLQDRYGGPEVLRLADIPVPEIADDQVLVQVHAAGVDRGVVHLMTGLPYPIRFAGYGVRVPKDRVRGRELAGRVAAVGSDVVRFRVGDEVFGIGEGTFAQYAVASASTLVPAPPGVPAPQLASVPVSGLTALQAVRDHGHVSAGQRVLVLGASGGVGSLAVQLAAAAGALVTGVAGPSKVGLVRDLGVADVLDHTADELPSRRYDVVVDCGGNRDLRTLRRALTPAGTLVIVGAETGGRWLGGVDRQLRSMLLDRFVGQTLTSFLTSENAEDLDVLAGVLESGELRPVVERAFPLRSAADAVRHLQAGRARGKVVVAVGAGHPEDQS